MHFFVGYQYLVPGVFLPVTLISEFKLLPYLTFTMAPKARKVATPGSYGKTGCSSSDKKGNSSSRTTSNSSNSGSAKKGSSSSKKSGSGTRKHGRPCGGVTKKKAARLQVPL